jgi:hypothetical protein
LNKTRYFAPLFALGLGACAPGGSSSTGVGNPGVISLSLVLDDEPDAPAADDGGAMGDGGAATNVTPGGGAVGDAGAGGASSSGAADAGAGGAPSSSDAEAGTNESDDDALPRASIEHAVIVLGAVSWQPCDTTLEPTTLTGPFIVDLLGNLLPEGTRPPVPDAVEPAGGFCGLEAPLAPASAPAELAGRSLFFDGVRSDGTRFVLYANVEAKLRVRRRGSLVWDADSVLWAFRPRRWLSRKELDATTPLPWDGASTGVVVDVNRHPILFAALRRRLAGKSSLFRDLNHNRQLDPEDRAELVGDGSDDPD